MAFSNIVTVTDRQSRACLFNFSGDSFGDVFQLAKPEGVREEEGRAEGRGEEERGKRRETCKLPGNASDFSLSDAAPTAAGTAKLPPHYGRNIRSVAAC